MFCGHKTVDVPQGKKTKANSSITKSLIMLTNIPPTVRYIKSRKICSFFCSCASYVKNDVHLETEYKT